VSNPVQDPARVARRRREHERQAVVFGVLVAFLLVAALGALAIYTGAVTAPFARSFTSDEQKTTSEPAPCLPAVDGQPDGALPLAYGQVQVRIYNASGTSGLAEANRKVLAPRGFDVLGTGNYDSTYDAGLTSKSTLPVNELRFGRAGVVAAYTLAAQFPDMALVLDSREDATVDLLVGKEYERPLDEADVPLAADQPLTNVKGCKPIDEVKPVPAPSPAPTE
jgi:hypothetical protein